MRILIFYQYFGTPKGGWSTRFYEFTRRWAQQGHKVTVVTSPYYKSDIQANGFISRQSLDGVDLIVINSPDSNKHTFFKRAFNAFRFALLSVYYALSEPHDIVLASSGPITTAIPALFSKWFRGKKMVFEVRDLWPKGGIEMGKLNNHLVKSAALFFEKVIYKNSHLVVACSPGMEIGVKEVNPDVRTLVISNSSDIELFQQDLGKPILPSGFRPNLPTFLYAGSLGEMDDCSQIINGLAVSQDLEFNMVFVGDGTERRLLENLTSKYNLSDKVFFLGLIPKTEVVKWFSISLASFVVFKDLPVLHTNSPNKLFDSFAAGVPVIQSTRGWIANLIKENHCGKNVDPLRPEEFANAMKWMIHHPQEVEMMKKNALHLAKLSFNRDILSTQYIQGLTNTFQN